MAEFGSVDEKGCVNLSLKDSGTKCRKVFCLLVSLLLMASMLAVTGVTVFAETVGSADSTADAAVEQSSEGAKTFQKSGYPTLDENATLNERLMYGLKIAGIGMVVVFLVLIIIMIILYVFKVVALSGSKKPAAAPDAVSSSAVPPVSFAAAEDETTIVAVATAAIAAARGASACAFKVISITKIQ